MNVCKLVILLVKQFIFVHINFEQIENRKIALSIYPFYMGPAQALEFLKSLRVCFQVCEKTFTICYRHNI